MFDGNHYQEWNEKRINFLIKRFGEGFFKGKSILELGCGYGLIGNHFSQLGADVECCEVRQENVDRGRQMFPHIKFHCIDLNDGFSFLEGKKFDIIIHFGTLYHLSCDLKSHLKEILNLTKDYMFLETEVSDSLDENFVVITNESNEQDQAINGHGQRPSPVMIEKILKENKVKFEICNSPELDCEVGYYSWSDENTGQWVRQRPDGRIKDGQRRFWIIEK